MVQKTQVVLIDDIDGTEADETVTFALDGVTYEIDLTSAHASELREAFATWIGHGRKSGSRAAATARPAGRRTSADRAQLAKIREWARENGHKVSDRGRISAEVIAAFEAAH
ncbi:histone-like nucleoid-structuring protein Lsr2 [Xylanimonas protaetiae]|uniref:Lsr2 family protein n=1 Tax=Xylanimonas protaetiae TaxID=2509457 RepID=A0A4P6F211_9MICO|nr:Lsr2 family protein [Xylanimonas protaetiae]QAY69185.1 Lsr2 family protein [Xylanimonas protaetiae]